MSLAIAHARAQVGLLAPLVTIETHLTAGLPAFGMVGLAETAVRESKERVRSAILNAGFEFPHRRITINLAPADIPKEGTRFDLAIALSILAASGQVVPASLEEYEFAAELALTGELRPVRGLLPAALAARNDNHALICAREDCREATLCAGLVVFAPRNLREVCAHLDGSMPLQSASATPEEVPIGGPRPPDLADIQGQYTALRGIEIAAAGGHNLLMVGPPGTGKTMLAMRLPGLLPPLSSQAALEAATIRSIANLPWIPELWCTPPFRSPHHTASAVAIIGGGANPRPGEVSLAHHGVLFFDELPEFDRRVLEVLREPLENFRVTISRAAKAAEFPADFQFIGAMNPCPCGYAGDPSGRCYCSAERITKYLSRISGPLLDRIDIQLEVPRENDWLRHTQAHAPESSAVVQSRVIAARKIQVERQGCLNSRLGPAQLAEIACLDGPSRSLLEQAFTRFNLSPRTYHRLLKLARTIADLAALSRITHLEIAEALSLRRLELRQNAGTGRRAGLYPG